jgi:PAS domain S-box-containing protein
MNVSTIAIRSLPTKSLSVDELIQNFKNLFTNSHDAMNLFSLSTGRVLVQNEAAYRLTGYTEADYVNIPIENFYPPEELPKVAANFQKQVEVGFVEEKVKMYCKGRELKDLWIRSYVVQTTPEIICITHTIDLTLEVAKHHRQIEEAKLAVLGLSAAEVAHELGNALQSFEYNIYKLEGKLVTDGKVDHLMYLENIKDVSHFMGQILKNISSYSVGKSQVCHGVSVNSVVESALQLLSGYVKHNKIEVRRSYDKSAPPVTTDPNQLQQIVVNIVKNAIQAMMNTTTKVLTVSTLPINGAIQLRIEDTGAGIPNHLTYKMFSLFETSNGPDQGSGIGLAIAKDLATKNKIDIQFETEINQGTQFVLSIPCSTETSSARNSIVIGENYNALRPTVDGLRSDGFEPFITTKLTDALKILELQNIESVICEQDMYPISGLEFARNFLRGGTPCFLIVDDDEDTGKLSKDDRITVIRRSPEVEL